MMKFKTIMMILSVALIASGASANPHHDKVMKMAPKARATQLGLLLTLSGFTCDGTRAFHMGSDSDDVAMWGVACSNGNDYQVSISANEDGDTMILPCVILKMANISCFEKLDD